MGVPIAADVFISNKIATERAGAGFPPPELAVQVSARRKPDYLHPAYLNGVLGYRIPYLEASRDLPEKLLAEEFRGSFGLLDALDEHENDVLDPRGPPVVRNQLLEALEHVLESCRPNCKLLITSRHNPTEQDLRKEPATVKIHTNPQEVKAYVISQLEDFRDIKRIKEKSGMMDSIAKKLLDNADGV